MAAAPYAATAESIANAVPPCPDNADAPSAVTISDLLSDLHIPPSLRHRAPPEPGVARRCCWCGAVERHPGDHSTPHRIADSVCLPCTIRVQFYDHARSYGVIALPLSAFADPSMPLRWRVYGELQRRGAGSMWIEPRPAQLALALGRHRRSIVRAITQLAAGGYLTRSPRRRNGAVTVYAVRLTQGSKQPGRVITGE